MITPSQITAAQDKTIKINTWLAAKNAMMEINKELRKASRNPGTRAISIDVGALTKDNTEAVEIVLNKLQENGYTVDWRWNHEFLITWATKGTVEHGGE